MTTLLRGPADARRALDEARAAGETIGLVPTMGALHAGHLALVAEAKRHASRVVVTVFVNPTQFGPNEDFAKYPRQLDEDARLAGEAGADWVFAPAADDMYPPGEETRVRPGSLAHHLCGPHRPGHFEGVATIVAKLFAVAGPCVAVFGRKDYQQLQIVKRLARDLLMPVEVVGLPTAREVDGVAMSSRNVFLKERDRERARALPAALRAAAKAFEAGERSASALRSAMRAVLEPAIDTTDYVEIADPDTLAPCKADVGARALAALAVRIGHTRLIDNMVLGEEPPPPEYVEE